jgi:hypothetical protein
MARLSNKEGDTSNLQTAADTLSVNNKDVIKKAEVVEGQAVLDGAFRTRFVPRTIPQ